MNPHSKSLLEIHVAVFFFGIAGLFGKLLALPPAIIVLGRVGFATVYLLLAIVARGQSFRLHRGRDYLVLSILGALLALHWFTFFKSVQVSTVAVGLLSYSSFPVFVTFLEPALFKEPLRPFDIVLALITLVGVALVVPRFKLADPITRGVLWGLASGLTFAILSILNRRYAAAYPGQVIAFYQDAVATLTLLPFLLVLQPAWSWPDLLWLAFLGIFCTGLAHSLFISALIYIRAQTASIIACLEPVYGIAAALLLLGEIPTFRVLCGGVIIVGATWFATTRSPDAR